MLFEPNPPYCPQGLAPFAERLARALDDLRAGRPILLMDDFERENEADLILRKGRWT